MLWFYTEHILHKQQGFINPFIYLKSKVGHMAGMNKGNRPTGISALAILEILGGVLAIIAGLLVAGAVSSLFGGLGSILGIVFIMFKYHA